ncbi:hypothetical protein [Puia dinghuensis]|uniref:Uncharacterized protein n=1 Tax=Puia dinghuensis TaxID=1792502 RepID=A0A8J2UA64_9BACT|nr:hypothetical protein [Puia dinghuensis]GGA89905.1 hypothetical protein GCM10011511_11420 [Puia dinghuensis]
MSYQILDNAAAIRFVSDIGDQTIMKKDIQEINIIKGDMLEIKTGDPLRTLYFRYADVTAPVTDSVLQLRGTIISMVANCLCWNGGTQM